MPTATPLARAVVTYTGSTPIVDIADALTTPFPLLPDALELDRADAEPPAVPVVLDARVVTGAGGGPEKTILNSPRFLGPLGYRMLCAYMHPPGDPGFEVLTRQAAKYSAPRLIGSWAFDGIIGSSSIPFLVHTAREFRCFSSEKFRSPGELIPERG